MVESELPVKKKKKLGGKQNLMVRKSQVKKKKKSGRKLAVQLVPLPFLSQSELEILCGLNPILEIPNHANYIDKNRLYFKKFFRGFKKEAGEKREHYDKELFEAIGVEKCLGIYLLLNLFINNRKSGKN